MRFGYKRGYRDGYAAGVAAMAEKLKPASEALKRTEEKGKRALEDSDAFWERMRREHPDWMPNLQRSWGPDHPSYDEMGQ